MPTIKKALASQVHSQYPAGQYIVTSNHMCNSGLYVLDARFRIRQAKTYFVCVTKLCIVMHRDAIEATDASVTC